MNNPNLAPRRYGKYRGKVLDNFDPLHLGRIIAEIPAFPASILNWAMPCVPYAGFQVGFYAMPPIGANVWIEYEGGDPEYPIWTGGFWGPEEAPDVALTPEMIVFKTNFVTMILNDTPETGGFTLECIAPAVTTPLTMLFNSEGITLSCPEATFTMTPEEIVLTVPEAVISVNAETITLTVPEAVVTMTAEAIEVTVPPSTMTMAAEAIEIESPETNITGNVGIEGAVEIEGDVNITGAVEIEGDVNTVGAVEVEGETNILGALTIEGETNAAGALTVEGETNVAGALTVEGDEAVLGLIEGVVVPPI